MYSLTHRLYQRIHYPRLSGFSALTVNYLLMQLAVEMVGSFGVLFVWQLGKDWTQSLFYILLFFGCQRLAVGLFLFPIGNLYARVPHQWLMVIAQIALVAKLWIFSIVAASSSPFAVGRLLVAFALGGLYIAIYYVGFHTMFLANTREAHVGKEIGIIDMLGRFSGVIAPIFAGVLINRFGFSVMFFIAMAVLAISSIPLFLTRHRHLSVNAASCSSVLRLLKREPRFARSIYFWLVEDAVGTFFWPVFLILVLQNYAVFGAIGSLVMFASSITISVVGVLYDKRPLSRIFPAASLLVGILWIVRFLSRTPVAVATADVLYRLMSPMWWMKLRRNELATGERIDRMEFALAHEMMVTLGSLSGLVIGYVLLVSSNLNWYLLLIPALGGLFMSSREFIKE